MCKHNGKNEEKIIGPQSLLCIVNWVVVVLLLNVKSIAYYIKLSNEVVYIWFLHVCRQGIYSTILKLYF